MPWHISRFHPDYKFTGRNFTSESTLKRAEELARKVGLNYVYAGNVYGWGSNTNCPHCGKLLIAREVFNVTENNILDSKCSFCKSLIPGVYE